MFKWILFYIIVKNIVTGDLFMNNLYPVDDILCFKCEPGTFWNDSCKNNMSKSECYPCPSGRYQSSYTVSSYCAQCTLCDQVVKNFELAKELSTCTSVLDTKCGCLDGWYLQKVSGSAREWFCKTVSMCRPGFEVQTKATNSTDTVCSPCLSGFYKNSFSLESCKPCTKNCSRGNEISSQCNSTHDIVCTEHNFKPNGPSDHQVILGVVVPVVILVIICIILWCVRNRVNKRKDGSNAKLAFNGPGDQTDRNSDQISWIMSYKELNGNDNTCNWTGLFLEGSKKAVVIHNWEIFIRYLCLECQKEGKASGIIAEMSRAYEQNMVRERIYNALDKWRQSCFDGDDDLMLQKFVSAFRKLEKNSSV